MYLNGVDRLHFLEHDHRICHWRTDQSLYKWKKTTFKHKLSTTAKIEI